MLSLWRQWNLGEGHVPAGLCSYMKERCASGGSGLFCAMYTDILKLEEELDEFIYDFGYQTVDLQIAGRGRDRLFRLFIDRVDGEPVTIDDCSAMASQVRLFLESKGVYNDKSSLEVSSGGLDRVIKRNRDYERYIGSDVRVSFYDGARKQSIEGELTTFTDDMLVITRKQGNSEPDSVRISRENVIRTNLVPHLEI